MATSGTEKSMEDRIQELNDAFMRVSNSTRQPQSSAQPKIQKTPQFMRDTEALKKYFVPKVYSFGPIHHGEPSLQSGEGIKLTLATIYVHLSGLVVTSKVSEIKEEMELKQWYDEEVTQKYDNDALSWMLFVDGCALLQYVIDFAEYRFSDKRREVNFWPTVANSDVFRLENQLPYDVLHLLMTGNPRVSTYKSKGVDPEKSLNKFIAMLSIFVPIANEGPRADLVATIGDRRHILDLMCKYTALNAKPFQRPKPGETYSHQVLYYRIQELKKVGITLKRGKSHQLGDVEFSKRCLSRKLVIPPMRFTPPSSSILVNMVAHEICQNRADLMVVTSYVGFLNSLVADAKGVEEMKTAEIMYNYLSSDEAVVELLRELASVGFSGSNTFGYVKRDISGYLKTHKGRAKVVSWFVEAGQVYFRTPWTTIAFLAAALAIALTMTNTIFTILRYHGK